MHPIKNIFFGGGCLLYLLVRGLRAYSISLPHIINNYVADFLFMPLLLLFSLWLTRIIKRNERIIFTIPMLVISFIFVSIIFEYYLPLKSVVYVRDVIDVIMYFLGMLSYLYLQRTKIAL